MSRRTNLRKDLAAVARAQSGYFTAAQALKVGYAYPTQKYHVERGNWEKVKRGIYRFPEWPNGRHDDLVCWTLWSHDKAVVSFETALTVHELGDVDPAHVHLTVPPGFRARAEGAVLHKGELSGEDIEKREGFNITPPLRSLVDVAGGDLELGHLARAIHDALDRGIVTKRQLRAKADEIGPKAALRVERALTIGVD